MSKFRIKLSELKTAVKETLKENYLQLDPSEPVTNLKLTIW